MSRNIQRPSGRREQQKETLPIMLTPAKINFFNSTKIDPVLSKILIDSGLKIRVEIGGSGQATTTLIDVRSGKESGTIQDIERIAGFRRFAIDEKKQSLAAMAILPIEDRITRVVQSARDSAGSETFLPEKFGPQVIQTLKDSDKTVRVILENRKVIENVYPIAADEQKPALRMLGNWVSKALEAHALLTTAATLGQETKGFLAQKLFELALPKWGYDRVCLKDFGASSITDYRRVIFPADSKKGIVFTVRELADKRMREENAYVLGNSAVQIKLVTDPEVMKSLFQVESAPAFDNEADQLGTSLRGEKILLSPLYYGIDYMFEPKTRGKLSSFSQLPDLTEPKAILRSVTEAWVQVQCLETRTGTQVGSIWDPLRTGLSNFNYKDNVSMKRNLFAVSLENKTVLEERVKSIVFCSSDSARAMVRNLLSIALRVGGNHNICKVMFSVIGCAKPVEVTKEGFAPSGTTLVKGPASAAGKATDPPVPATMIWNGVSRPISSDEDKALRKLVAKKTGLLDTTIPKKKKGAKAPHLGILGKRAKKMLERLTDDQRFLEVGLTDFFRRFTDSNLQDVAVRLVEAQLDDVLLQEDDVKPVLEDDEFDQDEEEDTDDE